MKSRNKHNLCYFKLLQAILLVVKISYQSNYLILVITKNSNISKYFLTIICISKYMESNYIIQVCQLIIKDINTYTLIINYAIFLNK